MYFFIYPSISKIDLGKKKTEPNLQVCPEYRYIELGLLIKNGNEMRKAIYYAFFARKQRTTKIQKTPTLNLTQCQIVLASSMSNNLLVMQTFS